MKESACAYLHHDGYTLLLYRNRKAHDVNHGFYIGVGGVVTFKNGKKLKEVVEAMPLDKLVIETDCPYLAPVPFGGKRNDSTLLAYVIEEIATLRGITPEEVERVTEENARRLYGL